MYLNPGNSGFEEIRNSTYVDKSGLIGLINDTIGTKQKLTCVSRPRRFGKSFAAQMLCAYYDRTCDSSWLFEDLAIATEERFCDGYQKHLNKYDVVYLDMTYIKPFTDGYRTLVPYVGRKIMEELTEAYPSLKNGSQSAISDFKEYSMVVPWRFAKYIGFTEQEVYQLCQKQNGDYEAMKRWYDGYILEGTTSIYNPNSVMEALRYRSYRSYWTQTSAADSLMEYISLDFDGLSQTIAQLLGGIEVSVDTNGFSNDLVTFRDRDDVLTLLIHLGYLVYNEKTKMARIPNEEIRLEFARAIHGVKHNETIRRVRESDQLIQDTIQGKEEAVAAQIEKIHRSD